MTNSGLLPLYLFGTLLLGCLALALLISFAFQKRRQVKNRMQRQQLIFEHNERLLQTRIEVQEHTLNMISHELHDNITQSLTGCYMQLNMVAEDLDREISGTVFSQAKENLLETISQVRLLSHSLTTGLISSRSLEEAIQAELSRIQTFSNLRTQLESDSLRELEPEQKTILFRIVQEVLQNCLKHAEARTILVQVQDGDGRYNLSITDDGKGFDLNESAGKGSVGLIHMQERIQMLQGKLRINSTPGKGTSVTLEIPITELDG